MCKYIGSIWRIIFQAINSDNPLGVELGQRGKPFYFKFFYLFKLFTLTYSHVCLSYFEKYPKNLRSDFNKNNWGLGVLKQEFQWSRHDVHMYMVKEIRHCGMFCDSMNYSVFSVTFYFFFFSIKGLIRLQELIKAPSRYNLRLKIDQQILPDL